MGTGCYITVLQSIVIFQQSLSFKIEVKQYLIGYPIKKQVRFLNGPKLSRTVAQFSSCDLKTRLFCNSKSRRNGHQAFEPCLKTRLKMLLSHRPDYSVRLLIFPNM